MQTRPLCFLLAAAMTFAATVTASAADRIRVAVQRTGTLGWELALAPVVSASPDAPRAPDPRVVAMTRNLLGHVLGEGA